jgi:diguanylate cyclase (GGDEF)-like protein
LADARQVGDVRSRRLGGALLLGAVYATAYLAVLTLETGTRAAVVVDDLGNLFSPTLAALACAFAARRSTGRARTSWALLAGYAGVWALGQVAWCWYEVVLNAPVPFPGLPDIGYVASVPFVLAALLLHPDAPRFASGALRLATDAVLVGASLLSLTWRLALGDAYRTAGAHGLGQVLGLAYPVFDVVVVTVLVLVGVRARGSSNWPFAGVATCLALGGVGHVVYGVLAQNGSWQSGNPVDAAWGIGFLFLALGALVETGRPRSQIPTRVGSIRSAVLPYTPLMALVLAASYDNLHGNPTDDVNRFLGTMIFLSVLVRQLLALMENSRLARGLEATVADRTAALLLTTDKLQVQAWSDPLTGMPNRARLFDLIEQSLACGPLAVALLDLDGFKSVNDSLGHAAGDALLSTLGERLVAEIPAGAVATRLGGDEFAFFLDGCTTEQQARTFGASILRSLTAPVDVGSRSLVLTGSLGLVLSCPDDTPESLLRNADVAMYAAKDSGKDRLRMFEPSMRDHLLERVALEADLRTALLGGQIVPWFQPVIDLETGRTVGVEALARWRREDGFCPPGVFVPLAEQSGLVSLLGRQVLRSACAQAARWNRDTPLTLSVNLSAVQLASEDLVDQVREALFDSGLAPERLVLEITETVLMEDPTSVGPRLAALRSLGIRIALDDFGTGYCALGYLQKIPVDIIKIDRAFVREVHLGARQSALAATVMTLAGSLDLEVIAEGIELPEQAARLRALGCRLAQGFLYSEALSAEELLDRLRAEHAGTREEIVVF